MKCDRDIFPDCGAFSILWNNAVSRVGPNKAGRFTHLLPAFAGLLAIAFLGERLHLFHVAGMAVIFSGIRLTNRTDSRAADAGMES